MNWVTSRYNKVCLVLDEVDVDCTTQPNGRDNSHYIIWSVPKIKTRKIRIDFRDKEHAQIADIKIHYYAIEDEEQQFLYDLDEMYRPSLSRVEL